MTGSPANSTLIAEVAEGSMLPKCNELFESLLGNDDHWPGGLTLNDRPSGFGIDEHYDR